jgi:hypothetical protein
MRFNIFVRRELDQEPFSAGQSRKDNAFLFAEGLAWTPVSASNVLMLLAGISGSSCSAISSVVFCTNGSINQR